MLNQESPISDNDNEISASSSSPSKNAFDRIREKLMNTRVRERFRTARERNLRKKGSKKRRRNKKRRRRRKNKIKNSISHKKWRISREKIREQNLLLKKLGK